jgi:hypothetical protein
MREAQSNTLLNQYLRETRMYCYYELKVCGGLTFNFAKIEPHQDEALPALAKEGLVWKLSDEDSRRKPCDGFCAPPLPSYLVIRFSGPKDAFFFIPYDRIQEMRRQGKRSIARSEAEELSTTIVRIAH